MSSNTTSTITEAQQELAEFSQSIFTDLQHDFHELNHEIAQDSSLEAFRHEYAKLFGILQKSMTNQARYIEKCRVLESEIIGNKAKVRTVTKLGEEDARSISTLNDEKDKKSQILNEQQMIFRDVLEENAAITAEIQGYEAELEQCVADERSQKDLLKQLKTRRTELTNKYDSLGEQIPTIQNGNKEAIDKLAVKDRQIEELLLDLKRTEEMLDAKQKEAIAEQQRLFELERDREATRIRLKEATQKVKDRSVELQTMQDTVRALDKKVRDQKHRFETTKSEKQECSERVNKFQKDIDQLNRQVDLINQELASGRNSIEECNQVIARLNKESDALYTKRQNIMDQQATVQESYADARKRSDAIRQEINTSEGNIEQCRREAELLRKQVDATTRDFNSKTKKTEMEQQHQINWQNQIILYENQMHNIDCEVAITKGHMQELQEKMFAVEKEREKYSEELSQATSQYFHAQEVLKSIESKVRQKNEEIQAAGRKISQQQSLYENVRGEREIAAKRVKKVEAEIDALRHTFGRLKFAIEQNKEDIRRKEKERIIDLDALQRIEVEEERLREKLSEIQLDCQTAQRAITAHEGELSKLDETIKDAEQQLKLDEKKLAEIKYERDHMSNMNVEREREIHEIGQKLAVLKSQCQRGEKDYDAQEEEIARIKEAIVHDQDTLSKLASLDQDIKQARDQIHQKQKLLMTLQAERAAMEEEMKIPINIHRWTLLESSDPQRFEKLKHYQELQTDLVARTKEFSQLRDTIKEKEAEYQELCQQIRRRPGVEVEQKTREYIEVNKAEKFSIETIATQLEACRGTALEYSKQLRGLQASLSQERNKWIKQKKRDIKRRAELQAQQDVLDQLGLQIELGEANV